MAARAIAVPGLSAPGAASLGVAAGGWLFTGALTAATPESALADCTRVLQALGGDPGRVAKAKAFLRDPDGWGSASDVLRARLPQAAPTLVAADLTGGTIAVELVAGLVRPTRFAQATRLGDLVFTDGCGPFDTVGALQGAGDLAAQARAALGAVCTALGQCGADPSMLVKVNNTTACWHDYHLYNAAYNEVLAGSNAARCSVSGPLRHPLSLIEVEAVASLRLGTRFVDSTRSGVGRMSFVQRADTTYRADLGPCKGPHSHGARAGDLVFIAGECPYDAEDALVGPGDIAAQTLRTLDNVRLGLEALGAGLDDVVKTSVSLSDMRLAPGFEAAYASVFAPPYPARSLIATPLGQYGILVEIEAIAVVGAGRHAVAAIGGA